MPAEFMELSPAKLNLFLKIINKRNDGYHNTTRSRQNLWVSGQKVELDKKDPGGEHE